MDLPPTSGTLVSRLDYTGDAVRVWEPFLGMAQRNSRIQHPEHPRAQKTETRPTP